MTPRIVLLLGKPPKPGTIVAGVRDLLEARGIATSTVLPHEPGFQPDALLWGADLVVHRGLAPSLHPLLRELDARQIPLCNPWTGPLERTKISGVLAAAGVPVPAARSVESWAQVLELARTGPVVAKAATGGRGSGVVAGWAPAVDRSGPGWPGGHRVLPGEPPGEGPYVVEEFIGHDGTDRKLYVAGDAVFGLLKPSTLAGDHSTRGEPFPVPEPLRELALAAAGALHLHLAGVDVVEGPGGPLVVDVNVFPGYRSVEGAEQAVADHLASHLSRPR